MSLILRLAVFLLAPLCYCQNPGNVAGHSLWIEASTFNDSTITKPKNLELVNALHFNFNPVIDPANNQNTFYKNLVNERYSFFIVFKSDSEGDLAVATLTKGGYKANINNKSITSGSEIPYEQVDSKRGFMIGFISSNNARGKKNNSIAIEDFYKGDISGKQQLMEVVYYPRILKAVERRKIESYLSVKYGISIIGDADYINSSGDTIWKHNLNKGFAKRVTGVGRDDASNLYQKQSGNAEKDGLYMGLGIVDTTNALNKYILKDKTFMLWGDNDGSTIFERNKNDRSIKVIKRTWKMQLTDVSSNDSIITQIRINKKEFALTPNDKSEVLWLAVNSEALSKFDYVSANYIKQSYEDDEYVYFNNVVWDTNNDGADTFTLIKGPDYFIEYNALSDCSQAMPGTVELKINGGAAPYAITISGQGIKQSHTTQNDNFSLKGLQEGNYSLTVTDAKGNILTATPVIDLLSGSGVSIIPVWHLDRDGQVLVTPSAINTAGITYEWAKTDGTTVTGSTFTATQPGEYTLLVTNVNGCKKAIPFTVKPANSGWAVFPNPVKGDQPFNAVFNLVKESTVNIRVNSMEGKSYVFENLGVIKDYTYTGTVITSGVYLVTATINGVEESIKLIVE